MILGMTSLKFSRSTEKDAPPKVFHVAVVGISGNEASVQEPKESHSFRSNDLVAIESGPGKSCLCNRFIRPAEDDYLPQEFVSVLSAADFSTPPINNDHFLYWGETRRTSDDGFDCVFSVIEQTEFIDDSNFQPFRSGKGDKDYVRRATSLKLHSPGKIQYYQKSQLGIENEFPISLMSDGRFNVDGFICTFDVSHSSKKPLHRQVEVVFQLLCQIVRQKKPCVLVCTKSDESSPFHLNEAVKLLQRKELKGSVQLVETSARLNVNVDTAFFLLAQLIERTSGHTSLIRYRQPTPYVDGASMRKERMDTADKAFEALVRNQVKDRRMTWLEASRKFENDQDFKFYCELWGTASAQKVFNSYMRQLRDREAKSRLSIYLSRLDRIFHELLPGVALVNNGWRVCVDYLQSLPVYNSYFADLLPSDSATSGPMNFLDDDRFYDSGDSRVPSRVLFMADAERCFDAYADSLRREEKRLRLRSQFISLLNETPYALPGRTFRDICVFLATEPSYTDELNDLAVVEKEEIYEAHQKKIIEQAKDQFLELLMEHVDLFQQKFDKKSHRKKKDIEQKRVVKTEEDLKEITDILRSDKRYRAMDIISSQREFMILKFWEYFQLSDPEFCWSRLGCWDMVSRDFISRSVRRAEYLPAFIHSTLLPVQSSLLQFIILGKNELAENLRHSIRNAFGDELKLDGNFFSIDFRLISGDLAEPQNAFQTSNYMPHGCFCVYDSKESFQYIRSSIENALLLALSHDESSPEGDYDNISYTPCSGLPTVIVFEPKETLKEAEVQRLRECGQDLVAKLQCPFLEISRVVKPQVGGNSSLVQANVTQKENAIMSHLKMLIRDIQERMNIAKSVAEGNFSPPLFESDLRIRVCMMCGDHQGGFAHHIYSPLISHTICYQNAKNPQSFLLETYLIENTKIRVEIECLSYHESLRLFNPNTFDVSEFPKKLPDGFVLVFAVKRKSSVKNMSCLMDVLMGQNALRPVLIIGVVESASGPSQEEAAILHEIENLCRERNALFIVTNTTHSLSIHTYQGILRNSWENKVSTYERASTATLNSTVPSLSDEEAVLIKSRSLERDKPTFSTHRPYFNNGSFAATLDSPTFKTFGVDRERALKGRIEPHTTDDMIPPLSRLAVEEKAQSLRTTRSSEDILEDPNGHTHFSSSESSRVSSDQDDKIRPVLVRTQRKSVPAAIETQTSEEDILLVYDERPSCSTISRLLTNKNAQASPCSSFSRSSSALNVASPVLEESKKLFHPLMRGIAAWQARSTDETEKERSAGHRLVGKLASAGYSSFMDKLNAVNANIVRASQPSPTAPIAMPELVEDNEDGSWEDRLHAQQSPTSDRQFLIRKRNKELKPPDRLRRVVGPMILPSQAMSLSYDEEEKAYPTRASLPEFIEMPKTSAAASPLDDNVFFSSPTEEPPSRSGSKFQKAVSVTKPKREKENRSIKKPKDKKKKLDETFEAYAQSPDNPIPLFVQLTIEYIEAKGIDTEGIYRVSGSRVHADQLLAKYLSNPSSVDLNAMDIPIYNVTTALKTFLSEQTPPVIPQSFVDELQDLNFTRDKVDRIQLIKYALAHLSATHFQLLRYIFAHLRRIADCSKKNKMDANNLTVCLWPTLCPIELPNDMARFEGIRVRISEILGTMITEYDKIFEPNHSQNGSPHKMRSLALEAAEAARQRSRHVSESSDLPTTSSHASRQFLSMPLPPPPAHPPSVILDGGSSSSNAHVKGPVIASLKSVQV